MSTPPETPPVGETFTRIVARHFHEHAEWPPSVAVHRRLGRELGRDVDVGVAVRDIPSDYGYGGYGMAEDRSTATVKALARFAQDVVPEELRLFVRAVNRLVEIDDAAGDDAVGRVTGEDLESLASETADVAKLKLLLQAEGLLGSGGSSPTSWAYDTSAILRRIGPIESIEEYFQRRNRILNAGRARVVLRPPPAAMNDAISALMRTDALVKTIVEPPAALAALITPRWLEQIAPTFDVARRFAEDIQRIAGPLADIYAQAERMAEMAPRLDLFENTIGARAAMDNVLASHALMIQPLFGAELARIADAIASSTSALGNSLASLPVMGGGLQDVALGWRTLLEADDTEGLSLATADLLVVGGRGVLGVNLAAGVEAGVQLDVEEELVAWDQAPASTRAQLLERLGELDIALPNKLGGAWERVTRGGPDAGSQAANSLIELLDWALRCATEGVDLLAWHATEQRPPSELDANGRPTRALKVRYLCREEPSGETLVTAFVRIINETFTSLQSVKHGAKVIDPLVVLRLIPTVEAVLTFVLMR